VSASAKIAAEAASASISDGGVSANTAAVTASASTRGRGAGAKTAVVAASASTSDRGVSVKIEKSRTRQLKGKRDRNGRGGMR